MILSNIEIHLRSISGSFMLYVYIRESTLTRVVCQSFG